MNIQHTDDLTSPIYHAALQIRTTVFIEEQDVPAALEIENEAACTHFVLYQAGKALATCRLLPQDGEQVKVQRMAVLKEGRGQHLGKQLMEATESYARQQGFQKVLLGAQISALGFYESLAYTIVGPEFLDANIPHRSMEKHL